MPRWIERVLFSLAGVVACASLFWLRGSLTIEGDFAANVAGATIGGAISVALALWLSKSERRRGARNAATAELERRELAIHEALRHVRAIRECLIGAAAMSINNKERLLRSLNLSVELARRHLLDSNLTDFPLRLTIEDASQIGITAAAQLEAIASGGQPPHADEPFPGMELVLSPAESSISELIKAYSDLRRATMARRDNAPIAV